MREDTDRSYTFGTAMKSVQMFVVWAADVYKEQDKDIEMKLAVFCNHCGMHIVKDEGGRKWLICEYCNNNSCGGSCSKPCWGAQLRESDAPVQ